LNKCSCHVLGTITYNWSHLALGTIADMVMPFTVKRCIPGVVRHWEQLHSWGCQFWEHKHTWRGHAPGTLVFQDLSCTLNSSVLVLFVPGNSNISGAVMHWKQEHTWCCHAMGKLTYLAWSKIRNSNICMNQGHSCTVVYLVL